MEAALEEHAPRGCVRCSRWHRDILGSLNRAPWRHCGCTGIYSAPWTVHSELCVAWDMLGSLGRALDMAWDILGSLCRALGMAWDILRSLAVHYVRALCLAWGLHSVSWAVCYKTLVNLGRPGWGSWLTSPSPAHLHAVRLRRRHVMISIGKEDNLTNSMQQELVGCGGRVGVDAVRL